MPRRDRQRKHNRSYTDSNPGTDDLPATQNAVSSPNLHHAPPPPSPQHIPTNGIVTALPAMLSPRSTVSEPDHHASDPQSNIRSTTSEPDIQPSAEATNPTKGARRSPQEIVTRLEDLGFPDLARVVKLSYVNRHIRQQAAEHNHRALFAILKDARDKEAFYHADIALLYDSVVKSMQQAMNSHGEEKERLQRQCIALLERSQQASAAANQCQRQVGNCYDVWLSIHESMQTTLDDFQLGLECQILDSLERRFQASTPGEVQGNNNEHGSSDVDDKNIDTDYTDFTDTKATGILTPDTSTDDESADTSFIPWVESDVEIIPMGDWEDSPARVAARWYADRQ